MIKWLRNIYFKLYQRFNTHNTPHPREAQFAYVYSIFEPTSTRVKTALRCYYLAGNTQLAAFFYKLETGEAVTYERIRQLVLKGVRVYRKSQK